jgi:hypothetical protein
MRISVPVVCEIRRREKGRRSTNTRKQGIKKCTHGDGKIRRK